MEDYEFRIYAGDDRRAAIALRDPGAVRFMLPVIERLKATGYTLVLVIGGWALKNEHEFLGFKTLQSVEAYDPHIVIRTSADLRGGGLHALPEQLEQLWHTSYFLDVDDAPGSSDRIIMHGRRLPDSVAVFNELAKIDLLKNRVGLMAQQVIVTGNPDFDVFVAQDARVQRAHARATLSLAESDFFIFFPGQLEPVASYMLRHTVHVLNAMRVNKSVVFLHTNHPRSSEAERALFSDLIKQLQCRSIDWQGASGNLGYGADLLMHTHSTEGLKSVFRGVPVVVLGFPETFAYDYMEAYPNGKPPFQVRAGAGFWVPEISLYQEAVTVFETAIQDDVSRAAMIKSARAAFNADGQSTSRVVELITQVFQVRRNGGTGSQKEQTLS